MLKIQLKDSKVEYAPGDSISGAVQWSLAESPDEIDLCLIWFTQGRGTQDITVVERTVLESVQAGGERQFSFSLPEEPYSFEGVLITLSWAIEALLQPSGEFVRETFRLSPPGEKFALTTCNEKSLKAGIKIRSGIRR